MKELSTIEEIKDKIINANGTLIFRWSIKTGLFGGIDEKTENYISEFKELVDEGTYIPLLKFDDDYVLMDLKKFTKKLKKKGIEVTTKLKNYPSESREKILRMCINTSRLAEESSIEFKCFYKSGWFG